MLIESSDMHSKLYQLSRAIRKSDLLFSEYKALIDLLQVVHDIVDGLEVETAGEKVLQRYARTFKNLEDK